MNRARESFGTLALAVILLGCGSGADEPAEPVARVSQTINVCDEAVPEDRYIDGFPAYAQCDSNADGEVWSNNGIDTAASSQGDDWVRTQRSGGYQCTELTRRYLHFRWGIDYQNGNAGEWCDGDLGSTLEISTTPVHGDLIVFAGGSCGAAQDTGHIAVVDTVDNAAGEVTFVEQNRANRRTSDQSCALCFLHVVANDGTGSGGVGGVGTGGAPANGGAPSGGGTLGIAGTQGGAGTGRGGAAAGGTGASGGAPNGSAGTAQAAAGTLGSGGAPPSGTGGSMTNGPVASEGHDPEATAVVGTCTVSAPGRHGGPSTTLLALLLGWLPTVRRRGLIRCRV